MSDIIVSPPPPAPTSVPPSPPSRKLPSLLMVQVALAASAGACVARTDTIAIVVGIISLVALLIAVLFELLNRRDK